MSSSFKLLAPKSCDENLGPFSERIVEFAQPSKRLCLSQLEINHVIQDPRANN